MIYLETIMLIALGFVLASLIALFLLRIVWHHGERVGRRRVQQQFPTTSEELRADRARLRAENAMMVRRHEMQVEDYRLKLHERTRQISQARARLEELGHEVTHRDDELVRLRDSRSPMEDELVERTAALQNLQRSARDYLDQIQRLSREVEAAHATIHDRDRTINDLRSHTSQLADAGNCDGTPATPLRHRETALYDPSEDDAPSGRNEDDVNASPDDTAIAQSGDNDDNEDDGAQAEPAGTGNSRLKKLKSGRGRRRKGGGAKSGTGAPATNVAR